MMTISSLLEFFLLALSFGIGFFYFLVPVVKMGEGFVKLMNAISGIALFLALVTHILANGTFGIGLDTYSIPYGMGLIAFGAMYGGQREKQSFGMWLLYGLQMFSLAWIFWNYSDRHINAYLYNLISSLFLGSVTFAMVLGHWYLVVPKLSEKPLKQVHGFLWPLLGIKLALTIISFIQHPAFFESGTELGGGFSFNWLLLTMRVGWGYLVIGIMSIFSWKLVKMRSIQSGTGMLYAMTFFIFVGELLAQYFFKQYGLML